MTEPLLRVEGLSKHFPITKGVFSRVSGYVRAVDDVSFDLFHGETLGLVGESGCGKSTVGRTLLRLQAPTAGNVWFEGRNLAEMSAEDLQRTRRDMQIVFQDPYSSLNPRQRVFDIVGEALAVHGVARGAELRRRVFELLDQVGVSQRWADRYAHEFSGGQRQRIGIARAIALEPKLLVCDEAVSALDVSIQAQIINLLIRFREQFGLSYLFISHDLSVVRHVSHRVLVMYLGQVVELGATKELFDQPAHPYTRALLSAVPVADPRRQPTRVVLEGDVPSPLNPPSGCRFHTRCPVAFERCSREIPALYALDGGRTARCFHAEGLVGSQDWYEQLLARFEVVERQRAAKIEPAGPQSSSMQDVAAGELSARGDESGVRPRQDVAGFAGLPPEEHARTASGPGSPAADELPRDDSRHAGSHVEPTDPQGWGRWLVAFAVGLMVVFLARVALQDVQDSARVRKELRTLHEEVRGHRRTSGEYPAALATLGYRLGFVFGRRQAVDPWGNPYTYGVRLDSKRVELSSWGRDGVAGTSDDIVLAEPTADEQEER